MITGSSDEYWLDCGHVHQQIMDKFLCRYLPQVANIKSLRQRLNFNGKKLHCTTKKRVTRLKIYTTQSFPFPPLSICCNSILSCRLPPVGLTQHPQSLGTFLVPWGQSSMVNGTGDEGVVVIAAHLQGEHAAHFESEITWIGLHRVGTTWDKEQKTTVGRQSKEDECVFIGD